MSAKPIASQYELIAERFSNGKPLPYGAAYQLVDVLTQQNPQNDSMYLMTDHIVYWLTGTNPLTKATTHPSNISKEFMLENIAGTGATTETEMAKVLALKPAFIVKRVAESYLRNKTAEHEMLDRELADLYAQTAEIDGRIIYKRQADN